MWGNKQPKVLIVEDDATNHPLFTDAFEAAGFKVLIVDHAEEGFVDEVASYEPDVISMDLMIAKTGVENPRDGFYAIDLLKIDDRTKHIPIIVVSNFFEEKKVQFAKEVGAVDYYNLQGQTISKLAEHFKEFVANPKKYKPSHPIFREA